MTVDLRDIGIIRTLVQKELVYSHHLQSVVVWILEMEQKQKVSILSFFKPRVADNNAASTTVSSTASFISTSACSSASSTIARLVTPLCSLPNFPSLSSATTSASSPSAVESRDFYSWSTYSSSASVINDVGVLFENDRRNRERLRRLSDEDEHRLLCDHWMPPKDFDWPYYLKSKQRVYLRANHISGPKYGCFKLSTEVRGVVCQHRRRMYRAETSTIELLRVHCM